MQNYLYSADYSSERTILAKNLRNTLYLSLESMPSVSSIIIIDENGNYECAARYTPPEIILDDVSDATWYDKAHSFQGASFFALNGGGIFQMDKENYLSLIRLINSTEDAAPLGYMIINIPMESLIPTDSSSESSDFCIGTNNEIVRAFENDGLCDYFSSHSIGADLDARRTLRIDGNKYIILSLKNEGTGLIYYSATPYSLFSNRYIPFFLISLLTIAISISLLLLIAFCTNHFVTMPVYRLTNAMKTTEQGNFDTVCVTVYQDEIGMLQNSYNEMLVKIQELLISKINEQKRLRKAELNILQEQIKPHFLYNSLSGIAYLIHTNQNQSAEELVLSLSEYYRESLSKGIEFIPLRVEINIVKNYLKLQKMRFPDMFQDTYDVEETALDFVVPRLFLQPLVENSLYHGIRPTGDFGCIHISVSLRKNFLLAEVADDGIGMTEEVLNKILSEENSAAPTSFGLRGTIERMRIFYEREDICHIDSVYGKGTRITFTIPMKDEEEKSEKRT